MGKFGQSVLINFLNCITCLSVVRIDDGTHITTYNNYICFYDAAVTS